VRCRAYQLVNGIDNRRVEIPFVVPEQRIRLIPFGEERPQVPCELYPDERQYHDPEPEYDDTGLRVNVLLFA